MADDDMPIRIQGSLGALMNGVKEEMSLTEFSEALSAGGAAETVAPESAAWLEIL